MVSKILLPCIGILLFAYAEYADACDCWGDGFKCNKFLNALFNKSHKEKKFLEKKADKSEPASTIVLMPASPAPPVFPPHHHLPCHLPPVCPPGHPKPVPCGPHAHPMVLPPHFYPHPPHHPHPHPHPIPIPPPFPLPPVALPPHFLPAPTPCPCQSPLVISLVQPDSKHHPHHHFKSHGFKPHHHSPCPCQQHSHYPHHHPHHHLPSLPCPLPPAVPMVAYAMSPPVPCTLEAKKIYDKKDLFHKCDKHPSCECDCDD